MTIHMQTVAEAWAIFSSTAVPKGAGARQVAVMKRAFYAGAYFLLIGLQTSIAAEDTTDEEGVAALDALKAEIEAFATGAGEPPLPPPSRPGAQAAIARILTPDTAYTTTDPDNIRPVLQELGGRIGSSLPEGWGFNLLLFPFGEPAKEGGVFYIANAERASVLSVMRDFLKSQVQ